MRLYRLSPLDSEAVVSGPPLRAAAELLLLSWLHYVPLFWFPQPCRRPHRPASANACATQVRTANSTLELPARGQSRTTTRSMARGFRAIYGSLSQEAENPAHNRAYPGSRPGGTTKPSKQACHRDDRSHHPTACKTTSPPLWLRRAT